MKMNSKHLQLQIFRTILLCVVSVIGTLILLTSCSKRDENVIGKWRVADGRNKDAIFEFTPESRLNIYGGHVQAFWYGLEVTKKIPLSSSKFVDKPASLLGMPDEQGDIVWEAKNKIKFCPEKKYTETEITVCNGSLYILTLSSKEKLIIEEMQLTPEKKLEKVGDMTLVPYNAGIQKK
jgi:hypothetical protein